MRCIRLGGAADERYAEAGADAAHSKKKHVAFFIKIRSSTPDVLYDGRETNFFVHGAPPQNEHIK